MFAADQERQLRSPLYGLITSAFIFQTFPEGSAHVLVEREMIANSGCLWTGNCQGKRFGKERDHVEEALLAILLPKNIVCAFNYRSQLIGLRSA